MVCVSNVCEQYVVVCVVRVSGVCERYVVVCVSGMWWCVSGGV